MSLNGKWRGIKIVEVTTNRSLEIVGGLKNALDRGSSIDQAKKSFISAGYSQEEVETAIQRIPSIVSRISKPLTTPKGEDGNEIFSPKQSKQSVVVLEEDEKEKKKASPALTMALIITAILVIGGGAAIYFFRDKLF